MAKLKGNAGNITVTIKPVIKMSLWTIIKLRILSNSIPEIKKLVKQLYKFTEESK